MSSTNKTTNYNLSQFIGTDKPAWLTDYNADMSKIDAGVAAAQAAATGADGKATANTTAIGDITNLATTAKTNLVAAVNEVDAEAAAAAGVAEAATQTANAASATANTAATKANAIADYFTMNNKITVPGTSMAASAGTIDTARSSITVALNNTASLGKVYGSIRHTAPTAEATYRITLNIDSGIHPNTEFTISPAGLGFQVTTTATGFAYGKNISMTFKPNGNIVLQYYADVAGTHLIYALPFLYFLTDFGDLPQA